jgi:tryptophan halogenase
MEYDRVRDFLILHFHATTRDDSEFWNHVRTMRVPDTLGEKMALWLETGRVEKYSDGLFYDASWIAVYLGQGVWPRRHDARTRLPAPEQIARALGRLRQAVTEEVAAMPGHREFLAANARRLAEAP